MSIVNKKLNKCLKFLSLYSMLAVFVFASTVGTAVALNPEDLHSIYNDTPWYRTSGEIGPCACGEQASATAAPADSSNLNSVLSTWAEQNPGSKLAVKNLSNNQAAAVEGTSAISSASLYKLFVARGLYKLRAEGRISFNQDVNVGEYAAAARVEDPLDGIEYPWRSRPSVPISECLPAMISLSENACGWALRDRILEIDGSLNNFGNSTIRPMEVTANDLITLLQQIAQGSMVNQNASTELEALMLKQFHQDKIPDGITDGSKVANKTGELHRQNSSNLVSHDTAIVRAANVTYVVAILTTLDPDVDANNAKIADLARQIHATMTGSTSSANCGGTSLSGGDNAERIWNFFLGKGLTPPQVAGIYGNIMHESSGNPENVQGDAPDTKDPTPLTRDDQGWGLIQWTPGSKILEAAERAELTGPSWPIYALHTQLELVWKHMHNDPPITQGDFDINHYKTITEYRAAVDYFFVKIEGAEIEAMQSRYDLADDGLRRFGQNTPGGGPTVPYETCSGGSGSGIVNADGYAFPIGPQRKSANWVSLPCNDIRFDNHYGEVNTCHHDNSPAADIYRGGHGNDDGSPVYAIIGGTVFDVDVYHVPGCYDLSLRGDDGWSYWYGHIQNPIVRDSDEEVEVEAGQQIAEVANFDFGSACRGSTEHLHIDRGYPQGEGGGRRYQRDRAFVPLLNEIWEALPD